MPEARRLVFDGQYKQAADLISKKILARPLGQMPYETLGDLLLSFPEADAAEGYRRDLNLETATASVTYTSGGVRYSREAFASAPDHVIVVRLTADQPGKISFVAKLKTPQKSTIEVEGPDTLVMSGTNGSSQGVSGALKFHCRVKVVPKNGTLSIDENKISVTNADEVLLLIAAATSYKSFDDVSGDPDQIVQRQIADAGAKTFAQLRQSQRSDAADDDPQLAALYVQFGRYLLISSSRPGGQPAGLQGLWNDSMTPPWGGKYTININTEMNYWPAEVANLGECVDPLVAMTLDLSQTGDRTAKEIYGAHGWVVHHNTDLWRASAPIDGPNWGMWPTGGAWLCLSLWDHYDFGRDSQYLKSIYPVLKGASEFFLDTLVKEPKHHWLVTNPSMSPENVHPFGAAVCAGPTMDMQILRDLFANTMKAQQILGVDEQLKNRIAAARDHLAPNQIGSAGQLQEWLEDWDTQAPEMRHRHVSHLYGLYPGHDITLRGTPELAAAVKRSLEIRGDKATGWATAWRICFWTHLADGDHALEILKFLLSPERTYPNMFDAHPPFQIDGNFGGAAGILEMLLQSGGGEIELLPALPKSWPTGSVTGLRARGGFVVGLTWKDGKLDSAKIVSLVANRVTRRYANTTKDLSLNPGESFSWDGR